MNWRYKLGLLAGFLFAFLVFIILNQYKVPEIDDKSIYKKLIKYSPYRLERRLHIGKYATFIVHKETNEIKRTYGHESYDDLKKINKKWIEEHVRIHGKYIVIVRYQKTSIKILLQNEEEKRYLLDNFEI